MSLQAKSVSKSRQTAIAIDCAQAILEDCYDENFLSPCSQSDIDRVRNNSDEREEFIKGSNFSYGAKWILNQSTKYEYNKKSLRELTIDLMRFRSILRSIGVMNWDEFPFKDPIYGAYYLLDLGIQFGWQATKWIELYNKLSVSSRPLGSCYQINQVALAIIAKNKPYWALPIHVLRNFVNTDHIKLPDATKGDMIGNIWDYIPASKVWVINPNIPKSIAVRIGREPWWKRMCASLAWEKTRKFFMPSEGELLVPSGEGEYLQDHFLDFKFMSAQNWHLLDSEQILYCNILDNKSVLQEAKEKGWIAMEDGGFYDPTSEYNWKVGYINISSYTEWYGESVSRNEITLKFWEFYQAEVSKGKIPILDLVWSWECKDKYKLSKCEEILELPHGFLAMQGIHGCAPIGKLYQFANTDEAIRHCFGKVTKSLRKAWEQAKQNPLAIRWAIAVAPKDNVDWQVKFLQMEKCIPYCEEAVNFLESLQPQTALKMMQTFTYKHHGEVHQLSDYHFKDTGMLFNNIVNRGHEPRLGRVRCWLTCHEELGAQYIDLLPNEPVRIPDGWERVQGLCGVKGDWSIQLPTNTSQLKYWGGRENGGNERLDNCMGGYGDAINNGNSIVFVVYWEGVLKYAVEVNAWNKKLSQFYGKNNSDPVWSERDSVCYALDQAGLLNY